MKAVPTILILFMAACLPHAAPAPAEPQAFDREQGTKRPEGDLYCTCSKTGSAT